MLDKDKPVQTAFSLICLAISLFILVLELWSSRVGGGMEWDVHTKIALGIGVVGLLLAPFNFKNFYEALKEWKGRNNTPT
jgi:hypothetical protein